MSASVHSSDIDGVHKEVFQFHEWTIMAHRSHILQSKCISPFVCEKNKERGDDFKCLFCRFEAILSFPFFPDMTYARNSLRLVHKQGFGIEFNCIDALKTVKKELPNHLVAASAEWMRARNECEVGNKSKVLKKPFDWTFTCDYSGSIFVGLDGMELRCEETQERIDLDKLRVKEEILFYDDIHLYEDELSDHGVAQCSVKIRVMKTSFYILLRYFLRIDNVMVRMIESRFYHEVNNNYILKETTFKEADLTVTMMPTAVITDPNILSNKLEAKTTKLEKLIM